MTRAARANGLKVREYSIHCTLLAYSSLLCFAVVLIVLHNFMELSDEGRAG